MRVSGVLVTRGNQPDGVRQILTTWPFPERRVWDNSEREDLGVYGRWMCCRGARSHVCFFQDDDCLVPVQALLDAYTGTMLLNVPEDESALVGWGAVLDRREAERAFDLYLAHFPFDDYVTRFADFIVTSLVPHERIDLGHTDFPWATDPDRLYHRTDHYEGQEEVRERCKTLLSLQSIAS